MTQIELPAPRWKYSAGGPIVCKNNQEVFLTPLKLPDFSDLTELMQSRVAKIDSALPTWMAMTAHEFIALHPSDNYSDAYLSNGLRHLDHPNGPAYRKLSKSRAESFKRSPMEIESLGTLDVQGECKGISIKEFVEKTLWDGKPLGRIRNHPSSSARNLAGWRVNYPSYEVIEHEVKEIQDWAQRNLKVSRIWTASIAMIAISTLHPLTDGNGRVSRMLFNSILRLNGMSRQTYVPLSEVFASCPGGKELREKNGYYKGDWNPFVSYILALMDTVEAPRDHVI